MHTPLLAYQALETPAQHLGPEKPRGPIAQSHPAHLACATVNAEQRDNLVMAPVATWLDALTERSKQLKDGKTLDSYSYMNPKTTKVSERTRSESFSYVALPFKDDKWLCDSYINAFGRLRVGQMFQDLDALAGRIAYKHCAPAEPVNVTASVDRILMLRKVDEIQNYNFVLAGAVSWTGRSSMEITVKGYAFEDLVPTEFTEADLPSDKVFLTANFTFVARNPLTHKSFAINRLLPVSEQEWIDYRRAESYNAKKKLAAKNSSIIEPSDEETRLVHDMWKASKQLGAPSENLKLMKNSKFTSTLFMQPQYRNRHSYMIFGGYLLRQAFELAYCAAAAFTSAGPRFVSLDSTTFKAPVPVGSVLSMDASVSYTEHLLDSTSASKLKSPFNLPPTNKISKNPEAFLLEPGTLVQVKVDTHITNLDSSESKECGCFIYSFFVPGSSSKHPLASVVPQTYSEMMDYVEGRRRAHDTANYVDAISS
ncbi:hypothetical protein METBIDRAFT_78400 [Metschnikowia bicuspidata var. bicuspidata NRRL YB-4993]|uniref:HotDog ACOT-type domain-containing protein n=1 Tax=Metschnikowia bicuspidata var. bicuspidata NRRL YB-4993 TaxID=869754 RepID=A0A1A0HBS5_9ASCO|nr:hypothetical protein METBIDRAFT_78400 [Metschnikowia bicuspidata var. bicuspidata NRRL YB-4993]OBA21435.1 hypothetical protein METBIDRAFT_78400 [Metschnikowia bicuspidata var. bicuspidata NRRL YB-4993]